MDVQGPSGRMYRVNFIDSNTSMWFGLAIRKPFLYYWSRWVNVVTYGYARPDSLTKPSERQILSFARQAVGDYERGEE